MEKLNIVELKNLKSEVISQGNKQRRLSDEKKTTEILITEGGNINYSEKYADGTRMSVSGNETSGFIKKETKEGSPIEKQSEFFGDGQLKMAGDIYKGIEGIDPPGILHAVGIWYTYDRKGNIVETTEFSEKDFVFTLKDVQAFLKKNKLNANSIGMSPTIITNGKRVQEATWNLVVMDAASNVFIIVLDGKTGKKIKEIQDEIHK